MNLDLAKVGWFIFGTCVGLLIFWCFFHH